MKDSPNYSIVPGIVEHTNPPPFPSLGPMFCFFARNIALNGPESMLRSGGDILRYLLVKDMRLSDNRYRFERNIIPHSTEHGVQTQIDAIYYDQDGHPQGGPWDEGSFLAESCDYILYFHGGAYMMCDSGDILCSRGLLPLLHKKKCAVFSLLYTTQETVRGEGHYSLVCRELLEAYNRVKSHVSRRAGKTQSTCIGLVGDSAGGHAVLCLAQQLTSLPSFDPHLDPIPPLVLISPWCDPFLAEKYSDITNPADPSTTKPYIDMLNVGWIRRSRGSWLGKRAKGPNHMGLMYTRSGQPASEAELAEKFAMMAIECGMKVIVFDLDQTAVRKHSMGRLLRKKGLLSSVFGGLCLSEYLCEITDAFRVLAAACKRKGLSLAIATHSDGVEYEGKIGYSTASAKQTFIIGEDLVAQVLAAAFPPSNDAPSKSSSIVGPIPEDFFLQAYNPTARRDSSQANAHKKRHMRNIAAHYEVQVGECLLLDDDRDNVMDVETATGNTGTDGSVFMAIQVCAHTGLDLYEAVPALYELLRSRKREATTSAIDPLARSLACPSLMEDGITRSLPRTCVVTGERELFFDENNKLVETMRAAKSISAPPSNLEITHTKGSITSTAQGVTFHIGLNDIHAYPLHHTHPLRALCKNIGAEWLFNLCAPASKVVRAEVGCDSLQSSDALQTMAEFLLQPQGGSGGGGGDGGVDKGDVGSVQASAAKVGNSTVSEKRQSEKILPSSVPRYDHKAATGRE